MLALSDEQLEQVRAAARALPARFRDAYLQTLAKLLQGQRLNPAVLQRACQQAQAHVMQLHASCPEDDGA
jgi:hypothetical protein